MTSLILRNTIIFSSIFVLNKQIFVVNFYLQNLGYFFQTSICCVFAAWRHIDGLVQDCSNSTANTRELLQYCTKPWYKVYPLKYMQLYVLLCFVVITSTPSGLHDGFSWYFSRLLHPSKGKLYEMYSKMSFVKQQQFCSSLDVKMVVHDILIMKSIVSAR